MFSGSIYLFVGLKINPIATCFLRDVKLLRLALSFLLIDMQNSRHMINIERCTKMALCMHSVQYSCRFRKKQADFFDKVCAIENGIDLATCYLA